MLTIKIERVLKNNGIDPLAEVTPKSIRIVNKEFRINDESFLWPINGRFNATDRAITRMRKMMKANGPCSNLEYILGIDGEISNIVNNEA
jgi:hypothetical protein